jgi:imidazole glycerol-phosphate synthase subunit HisH
MPGPEVVVIRTGTANLASVLAGLVRAGANPRVARDPLSIESASHVVLPGVGAFGAAMVELTATGCVEALRTRIAKGRPTLSVCLGLQLLCKASEENPGVEGLGVVAETVTRFSGPVRIPQMGWNKLEPETGCSLLTEGYAYFANSFRLAQSPEGFNAAFADHGGKFVAAMEKGAVLACQFHPELSGEWGLELLKRWLACKDGGASC